MEAMRVFPPLTPPCSAELGLVHESPGERNDRREPGWPLSVEGPGAARDARLSAREGDVASSTLPQPLQPMFAAPTAHQGCWSTGPPPPQRTPPAAAAEHAAANVAAVVAAVLAAECGMPLERGGGPAGPGAGALAVPVRRLGAAAMVGSATLWRSDSLCAHHAVSKQSSGSKLLALAMAGQTIPFACWCGVGGGWVSCGCCWRWSCCCISFLVQGKGSDGAMYAGKAAVGEGATGARDRVSAGP